MLVTITQIEGTGVKGCNSGLGARTLLVAPGIATSNKKLLVSNKVHRY